MKTTKEFKNSFFDAIEKSLKLEFDQENIKDRITVKSLSNALYNDLLEFLESFKSFKNLQPDEPGFGEDGLLSFDEKDRAEKIS